jgi:hypothetical protein
MVPELAKTVPVLEIAAVLVESWLEAAGTLSESWLGPAIALLETWFEAAAAVLGSWGEAAAGTRPIDLAAGDIVDALGVDSDAAAAGKLLPGRCAAVCGRLRARPWTDVPGFCTDKKKLSSGGLDIVRLALVNRGAFPFSSFHIG